MSTAISVFYSEEVVANANSYSPSAGKPKEVVAAWQDLGLPIELRAVVPATPEQLAAAHAPRFVADILACRAQNGFGNCLEDVARSLPYTSGAMLGAAREALVSGIGCAPVSGFHHAGFDRTGAFCTFNGLAVAAVNLRAEGKARRIMILDCDMHFGDGTQDIINTLGLASEIVNVSFGLWDESGEKYLERLEREVRHFHEFDLVLYQAGADVHIEDPLGGVLDTPQMRRREQIVFQKAESAGVPLAWNLAGGYQKPLSKVVDLHAQTMQECVAAYLPAPVVIRRRT